jgi:heme exporter protein A
MGLTASLSVSDLTVARGGVPVLEGVNFAVEAGRALILRGPNGSGKTTLHRTLAGLQKPVSGSLNIPEDAVAYAGHADGLKSTLSVGENLAFWAAIYGTSDINDALWAYDLFALQYRPAQNLSAGQKRRLGLARLMVTGRPIWMLDEPTVSLDADAVAMFAKAVRAHLGAGGVAVMATHIELGISEAEELDLTPFKPELMNYEAYPGEFDEAVE